MVVLGRCLPWIIAYFKHGILLVLSCLCVTTLYANPIIADKLPETLAGRSEFLRVAPNTDGSLEYALSQASDDWTLLTNASPNFSFDKAAYWIRFQVVNSTDETRNLVFDVAQPLADYIDAWLLDSSGAILKMWQTGDRRPTSNRPILYRAFAFPIAIQPGQTVQFLARFDTHDGLHESLPMQLVEQSTFYRIKGRESFWFGIYYGSMVILLLYNFVVGLVSRESNFIWYSLYLGCFLAWNLAFRGYLSLGVLADSPHLNNIAIGFSSGCIFLALIAFTRRFLNLRQNMPRTDRLMVMLAFLTLGPVVMSLLNYSASMSVIGIPLSLFIMAVSLWIGIYLSWKGFRAGKIYLLAWMFLIAAAFAYFGRVYGLLPSTWLIENALNIGSTIEMLVLSFAIADRLVTLKNQRQEDQENMINIERDMNHNLRRQVNEKTLAFQQLAERLKQESITDVLTGLRNRRTFDETLHRSLHRRNRQYPYTCMALIDIDHFKSYNDRFGHPAGDEVLKRLSSLLQSFFKRADDYVFRLGGEEFAVVISVSSPACCSRMMERFQRALASLDATMLEEPITVSIGVICASTSDNIDPAEFYSLADKLLYQCKEGGRNQFQVDVIR